jgi:hypothetical protein
MGSLIERIIKDGTKLNTIAIKVVIAINPRYASKVIFIAALGRLSCKLFNSLTKKEGTIFDALRKRESSFLFIF